LTIAAAEVLTIVQLVSGYTSLQKTLSMPNVESTFKSWTGKTGLSVKKSEEMG
jgi:hypothetical protein